MLPDPAMRPPGKDPSSTSNVPTLEAELFDGSGSLTLVWLGRRRIPGIEPGRTVTARGRFAAVEGKRVIYNPWYELGAG